MIDQWRLLDDVWCETAIGIVHATGIVPAAGNVPATGIAAVAVTMSATVVREAQPPLLAAGIVADVDVIDGRIVGGIASRPSLQMPVYATRITFHIHGPPDRMIAPAAAS